MIDPAPNATLSRNRRRRSSRRGEPGGPISFLRHPQAGRVILITMLGLTLLHIVYVAHTLQVAKSSLGVLATGLSREEVRYFVGPPPAVVLSGMERAPASVADAASASEWRYRSGRSMTRVTFASDDRVTEIECADAQLNSGGCPLTLGLGVGSSEEQIWYKLGAPSRQSFDGDAKRIHYDDLRLSFTLRKFQATAVRLTDGPGSGSIVTRLLRVLVP